MPEITLYHRAERGGVKVWSVLQNGAAVTTTWGYVGPGMKRQSSIDVCKPVTGKTDVEVAIAKAERLLREKRREGYVDSPDAIVGSTRAAALDFNDVPRAFKPAKPLTAPPPTLAADVARGEAVLQRKRDGMRHFLVFGTDGHVRLYNYGIDDVSAWFPTIIAPLTTALAEAPMLAGTIFDGEMLIDRDGADDFPAIARVTRSLAPKSLEVQRELAAEGAHLQFMLFDALWLAGDPLWHRTYAVRWDCLQTSVAFLHAWASAIVGANVLPVETLAEGVALATSLGWEGLVAWWWTQASIVRMDGSPARVNCCKVKPFFEDDFIATGYELGIGKFMRAAGALRIVQRRADGSEHDCGRVGTGFDDRTRFQIPGWTFPLVVQVEFAERLPSGQLRFPVFKRTRPDKPLDDVRYVD